MACPWVETRLSRLVRLIVGRVLEPGPSLSSSSLPFHPILQRYAQQRRPDPEQRACRYFLAVLAFAQFLVGVSWSVGEDEGKPEDGKPRCAATAPCNLMSCRSQESEEDRFQAPVKYAYLHAYIKESTSIGFSFPTHGTLRYVYVARARYSLCRPGQPYRSAQEVLGDRIAASAWSYRTLCRFSRPLALS